MISYSMEIIATRKLKFSLFSMKKKNLLYYELNLGFKAIWTLIIMNAD